MKKTLTAIGLFVSGVSLASAQIIQFTNGGQAFGQINGSVNQNVGGNLLNILATAQSIVNRLVPFAIGLAVVALFYGIIEFIIAGRKGDGDGHDKALKFMGMSILALFVMVSVWGLVGFLGSVLGVGQGGSVPVPNIPTGPTAG